MKTISTILLAAVLLAAFQSAPPSGATPQKIQGIDVYVMSEPTRPYEILETKTKAMSMLSCDELINVPVNRAAKVEGAQGVIIYFPQSGKYAVIKYKD